MSFEGLHNFIANEKCETPEIEDISINNLLNGAHHNSKGFNKKNTFSRRQTDDIIFYDTVDTCKQIANNEGVRTIISNTINFF